MTSLQDLVADTHKEVIKIAKLQGVHGRRLDDARERHLDFSVGLSRIESATDRANGRLDLMEETLNAHGATLDEIVRLLRKGQ